MTSTRAYTTLFDAHDGGHYDLPPEVIAARTAYDRLAALVVPEATDPHVVRGDLTIATVEAFLDGADTLPDCAGIDEARRAAQVTADERDVYRDALEILNGRVVGSVDPTVVLTNYLAPAHDETVTELREAWALVDAHAARGGNPYAMPKATAAAAMSVDALILRYEAIRRARANVTIGFDPEVDVENEFALISNPEELWTKPRHNNLTGSRSPWAGLDTAARLRYWFAHGGKPWLPTHAQQDDRYRTVYAEWLAEGAQQREREREFATNLQGY